jgi:hypothetical protein
LDSHREPLVTIGFDRFDNSVQCLPANTETFGDLGYTSAVLAIDDQFPLSVDIGQVRPREYGDGVAEAWLRRMAVLKCLGAFAS